jgi:diacylglycerol kinase family enzyme
LASRFAAGGALVVSASTLAALVVFTARDFRWVLCSVLAAGLAISALWLAATNRHIRWLAAVAALVFSAAAIASIVAAGRGALPAAVALFGIILASLLGTLALRWEVNQALQKRWHEVPPASRGVLLMNPESGNGKVSRFHLAEQARLRGIEPVLLEEGEDLRALAEAAAQRGADALGMAGGDGSQGVVATVAAAHEIAFVCVPAGTRNHFAMDLGIDHADPIRALGAFGAARESVIDLAEVNGRVFVNNVSLGVYARIVASDRYREAKQKTVAEMLPELLGRGAQPFGLVVESPQGPITNAQVVQVSNNPYELSSVAGFGSRARLDAGVLGIATVSVARPADVNRLVALEAAGHLERYPGWRSWTATDLEMGGPSCIAAAADGEAVTLQPPLRFVLRPGALRVRIAPEEKGASPAFLHAPWTVSTLAGLARVVRGRPSGIVAYERENRT